MAKLARIEDVTLRREFDRLPGDLHFERLIWLFMGLGAVIGIIGAPLGIFGPLSARSADGSLQVAYARFSRLYEGTELRIRLPGLGSLEGRATLWIERSYLENYHVEDVFPQPQTVETAGERVIYSFTARPGQSLEVTLKLTSQAQGMLRGRLGWGQDPGVQLSQLVLP